MNLLNKLTIKDLKLNKKRSIMTIIGIMLSVALITAVASMYNSFIASEIAYEKYEYGNFHVAFMDVPSTEVTTINNNAMIKKTYITKNIGYAYLSESKNEYKPYIYVLGMTSSSLDNLSVNLTEGRLPENENEIVIPSHLKTNGRVELNVGDTITIEVGTRVRNGNIVNQFDAYELDMDEEIVNTTTKTYTIVGIVERPSTKIEPTSAPGYTFITYIDDENISGNVNVYAEYTDEGIKNYLSVTANILGIDEEAFSEYMTKDYLEGEEFEAIYKEVSLAKYEYQMNNYLIELETDPLSLSSNYGSLIIVLIIVSIIIVITSVFCIKNSFDISISEKVKQYGMLKSIGATKKQIRKNVFYEGAILGIIGIPLGILAGLFATYILIIISNFFLTDLVADGFTLKFSTSLVAIIFSCLLGIITIYLSSLKSAKKASSITPIEAIKNSSDIKIESKKLKCPKIISKIFGVGGEISYKNIKRNKKKYRTTVISITISVITFIALYSFMNLGFSILDEEVLTSSYNLSLSLSTSTDELLEKAIYTTTFDNINEFTIERYQGLYITNPKYNETYVESIRLDEIDQNGHILVVAVGEEQYKKYVSTLGLNYNDVVNKGILVDNLKLGFYDQSSKKTTYKYMREFTYTATNTINLTLESTNFNIEIAYVTDELPFAISFSSSILIVSDTVYDEYINYNNGITIYYDSSDANALQDEIDKYLDGEEYDLYNLNENVQMMKNIYILMAIFLYGFIIVISLIGITNIFNTITTSMNLRKREFATFKSIGMTKNEFDKMITLESIFTCFKSLIIGIPIGLILSYIIYAVMGKEDGLKYNIPALAIVMCIIVVLLLIISIMKYSTNKVNKQNTIETIRRENI